MAIFVDAETRLVVQGLTGSEGRFHGLRNRAYGTTLVAGVTPGKGGQDVEGVPVLDTVEEAVREHGANTSMNEEPTMGSPPIPTMVEFPSPRPVSSWPIW